MVPEKGSPRDPGGRPVETLCRRRRREITAKSLAREPLAYDKEWSDDHPFNLLVFAVFIETELELSLIPVLRTGVND